MARSPRKFILCALVIITTAGGMLFADLLSAQGARFGLFRKSRDHFVVSVGNDSSVNWTAGYLTSRAAVRLPRIIFDAKHPDFGKPGTVLSISAARTQAREEARRRASRKLLRALAGIRLDSNFRVLDKMRANRMLRDRMGAITERFLVKSRRTGEGRVSVELALPFHTNRGLYALVSGSHYSREEVPRGPELPVMDKISGLVIDVSEFRRFEPSLEPRIFSDQGRRIYGPEVVRRHCVIRRGLASYYTSRAAAEKDRFLGNAPYYVPAAGVSGRGRSDIFLSAEDTARIIGTRGGRRALRNCAVAFVLPKR